MVNTSFSGHVILL